MAESSTSAERVEDCDLRELAASLRAGVILFVRDGTMAWANQAALAMHGVKRMAALGATIAEYRARFDLRLPPDRPLPSGKHPIERLLAGEAPGDLLLAVAPAGLAAPRWTHRARALALRDAAGRSEICALILDDETRMQEAEQRFERLFAANPAPAVILRLSDLRYVKANAGFLELFGRSREAVLGHSAQELDVLEGAKWRALALQNLHDHEPIPQMEAWPRLPDGTPRLVLLAGQPIEMGGAACMLFTFADLEPRREIEVALAQSERRFETAFRLAPVAMAVASLVDWFRFTLVNDAFAAMTGHAAQEAVGRTAANLGLWGDPAMAGDLERRLRERGSARDVEVRLRTRDGRPLDCLLSAEAVAIGGEPCALWAMQDVTDRRRTEAELAAAIEAVMRDTTWFSRTVLEKLAALRRPAEIETAAEGVADLTRRGREVLGLVCRGLDDASIADRLCLSRTTVRNHVNDLYRRTGARGRAALVVWARERGFAGEEPNGRARRRRVR